MNPRITSTLSYFTPICWIIALVLHRNTPSLLSNIHLKNSLGLHATGLAISLLASVFRFGVFQLIFGLAFGALFILFIIGIITAIGGREKALPYIGPWFQNNIPNF